MTAPALTVGAAGDLGPSGGTLALYGPGDLDHLDPACAYHPPAGEIVRLFSRQLVTYAPHPNPAEWQATTPVPDIASDVPSTYNGGLGASHRSYVLHLRGDVFWDTTPPRPVTAHDFVRGFKRLGNPVARTPALAHFTSTIRGMAEFCDGFAAAVGRNAAAADLAEYQNTIDISGIFALDDETLVIELIRPALEFPRILALSCASAAPAEYDAYLPDSPELRANIRSNGPYRPVWYLPGRELLFEANPVWRPESDPARRRHLEAVAVVIDNVETEVVAARLRAGEADLPFGRPAAIPTSRSGPHAGVGAWALDPYVVFNLAGGGPVADVRVRRAVAAAVDRQAMAGFYRRRGAVVTPTAAIVPPGNEAHRDLGVDGVVPGPDLDGARAMLADAGYPDGLELAAVHPDTEPAPAVGACFSAGLAAVGISVQAVSLPTGEYFRLLGDPARRAERVWDVTLAAWSPDWVYHDARMFLQPLFATTRGGGSGNYGGYSDPAVDDLIERALEATAEPARAVSTWHEVEQRVLDAAAVVPILHRAPAAVEHGPRVRGAVPMPALGMAPELTGLWLDQEGM